MEIDESKKRKTEENEVLDLDIILKEFLEANKNLCKLIALLAQKTVGLEKVFNKDLFKQ